MKQDELYFRYLKNELYFSKLAIENINSIADDENGDPKLLFYHSNVLFSALANISKLICDTKRDRTTERPQRLRTELKIEYDKIQILNNRKYRNSNEHYDERIDNVIKNVENYYCIDFSVADFLIADKFQNFGRIYITKERTFYFINAGLDTESICLNDIEEAINYIRDRVDEYFAANKE